MVRVLTVNGVTDLDNAALGHVLRIVYCNKVVMSHRATLVKLFKHYDTQSIQMLFSTILVIKFRFLNALHMTRILSYN